jgi:hypothetical protein
MATEDRLPIVTLRNAEILPGAWRDFSGEGRFNEDGKRRFNIKLDPDVAQAMMRDGFNIKELKPREEDEDSGIHPGYRIEVAVSYKFRPPQVWLVSGGHRTLLDEGSINILDYADIAKASIAINPSAWEVNNKTGIKAYLHKAVIYLVEDELDDDMRDIPIAGAQPQGDVD